MTWRVLWSCDTILLNRTTVPNTTTVPLCPHMTAISLLPLLLSILTVGGNLLVLFVIFSSASLRSKETNILLANLSLADLMVGLIVTPFGVVNLATSGRWLFSRMLCRIWISLDVICCTASIATLCAISIDRLIGVIRPMHYKSIVTSTRIIVACVLIWIFSLTVLLATIRWVSLDSGIGVNSLGLHYPVCRVGMELKYVIHSVILSFFIPLAVILVVYFKIYKVVHKRETSLISSLLLQVNHTASSLAPKQTRQNSGCSGLSSKSPDGEKVLQVPREAEKAKPRLSMFPLRMHYGGTKISSVETQAKFFRKQKKSAKMLAKVVGAFFICWFPFFLLYMINHLCDCIPDPALEFFTWLGYLNSGLNPIIYALAIKAIGNHLRETCHRARRICCHTECTRNDDGTSDDESTHSLDQNYGLHFSRTQSSVRLARRFMRATRRTLRRKRSANSNADCGYWSDEPSNNSHANTVNIKQSHSWMTAKLYSMLISTQVTPV